MYLLDILVKISQALLTPAITIMSIYLVHKNNSYKQNHDLYERRLPIYQSVWNFVDKITTYIDKSDYDQLISEALRQFRNETKATVFFFGEDIVKYIKELEDHAKALKVNFVKKDQEKYDQFQRDRFNDEYEKEVDWFHNQNDITDKFMKYLNLNP